MKRALLFAVSLLMTVYGVMAQTPPTAVLEYVDNELELAVFDRTNFEVRFFLGMALSPGDRVETAATGAEIRLQPNGSIIRIAPNTVFVVASLQGRDSAPATRLEVGQGRVRMVAARVAGIDSRYEVRTPNAVAGVRGTDFGVLISGDPTAGTAREELFVFSGEVAFESALTGQEIFVGAGQRADAFAVDFSPQPLTAADQERFSEDLEFNSLDPGEVPGAEITDVIVELLPPPPEAPPEPEPRGPGFGDRLFGSLAEITGMEVGSVTLNNETLARVVFQPRFSIGRLAAQFYLPITYRENLFDKGTWYRPAGNDEWSFGSDYDWQRDPLGGLRDLGTDIALKIRFISFASPGDPFFFKLGNISGLTVGNGLLMDGYANDSDFPAVRRLGLNLGVDRERWGLEAVVNDALEPEIMGGRLYFRPAAPVIAAAVGFTGLVDIGPGRATSTASDSGTTAAMQDAKAADLLFLNVGADLTVPVVNAPLFRFILFGETGGMIPYIRNPISGLNAGLKTDALVDFANNSLRNVGWAAGVRGRLLIVDYTLAYRTYDGVFRPGFFDATYDRLRAVYAAQTINYLRNPSRAEYKTTTMGVFGRAGADILGLVRLSLGYFWPWEVATDGSWVGSDDDELTAGIELRDGLLPLGITTGFAYRRTHFAATVGGWGEFRNAQLFDAYTTLDAFVAYPLTPQIRLVGRVSTAVQRDSAGNVRYDDLGRPRIAPVVIIQTQIGL